MNIIEYATELHTEKIRQLWEEAFGNAQPYTGWYFHNIFRPERTLCLFIDDIPAGCLQYAPRKIRLNGQDISAAYIVGLCVSRKHRHHGYATMLMKRIADDLTRQGYQMLLLYPDIPDFYRKLGFIEYNRLRQVVIPAESKDGSVKKWRAGTLSYPDLDQYAAIYKKMTAGWDGWAIRNYADWLTFFGDFLCDNGAIFLKDDAYLLCCEDESGIYHIKEAGFADGPAMTDCLEMASHLAATKDLNAICWDAPEHLPFNGDTVPYVMAKPLGDVDILPQKSKYPLWINEMT